MPAKTYDPKRVIITWGGVPISGFADGSFITVTSPTERFTKTVGADGEITRTKSNDNTHEVTITLKQSSNSNDYLSAQLLNDKLTNLGVLPLQIIDLSGTSLFFWDSAWIQTPPDAEFSNEATDRAWVLATGQAISENYGGNLF